jgi:hypothetical protein
MTARSCLVQRLLPAPRADGPANVLDAPCDTSRVGWIAGLDQGNRALTTSHLHQVPIRRWCRASVGSCDGRPYRSLVARSIVFETRGLYARSTTPELPASIGAGLCLTGARPFRMKRWRTKPIGSGDRTPSPSNGSRFAAIATYPARRVTPFPSARRGRCRATASGATPRLPVRAKQVRGGRAAT